MNKECSKDQVYLLTYSLNIISLGLGLLMYLMAFILLKSIYKESTKIHILFLEIPIRMVIQFHHKCEVFMKNIMYHSIEAEYSSHINAEEDSENGKFIDVDEDAFILLNLEEGKKRNYKTKANVLKENKSVFIFLTFSIFLSIIYLSLTTYMEILFLDKLAVTKEIFLEEAETYSISGMTLLMERYLSILLYDILENIFIIIQLL